MSRLALLLACAIGASPVAAAEATAGASPWRFSGFGTLGVTHADADNGWLFARDVSQRGADGDTSVLPDSRLGLQLNWQPGSQWEGVLQAVLRPRVRDIKAHEVIELGFVAWRPAAGWALRAGRLKPDLFLLHNSRNVGYSMPWVRPSMEFYGWIPGASLDGGSVAYEWLDAGAQWSAQAWLGQMSNTLAALRSDESIRWKGRDTVGFTLTRSAGSLTLKASLAQTETSLSASPELPLLESTLLGVAQLPVGEVADSAMELYRGLLPQGTTRYLGVGVEYEAMDWLASAEMSRVTIERGATGGTRGYASLGRRFGKVTVFALAGFSEPRYAGAEQRGDWVGALTPYLGETDALAAAMAGAFAEAYGTDARFEQKSVGIGLRWEVLDRVALKTQFDHFRVAAQGGGQWRHSTDEPGRVNLLSVAADWVF